MTNTPGRSRFLAILLLSGSAACASSPGGTASCDLPIPSTSGWETHDEGEFTIRLPAGYSRASVQGIDSRVGRWDAPGKHVSYDFGAYANPLQPNDVTPFPGLAVCQESEDGATPRIVRYSPAEGGHVIAGHWPGLGEQAPGMTQALTVEGTAQRPEDLGEMLAIIRSVRIEDPEGVASLRIGEEWEVVRLEDTEAIGAERPTLSFSAGGELTGNGGCNRFRATYETSGQTMEIGPALATRRACVDAAANAQEGRFFALLEQVTRFEVSEDGGLMLLAGDRPVIVARPGATAAAMGEALITPQGWGPLRIGMTRAEVVAAAGEDANPQAVGGPDPEACDEFRPENAPEGLLVMIEQDRLTRITLSDGTGITTERGFEVGDPADEVEAAYGAEAVTTPHKYVAAPAAYITVWTTEPPGPDARGLVYEIGSDGRVMHIHAGGPSIQYVEGCL